MSAIVFAASVAAMFGASALYHRVTWSPRWRPWMRRLDHAGIYALIGFEDSVNLNEETYGPEVRKLLQQPTVPYVVEGRMVVKGIEREFRFEGDMEFAR